MNQTLITDFSHWLTENGARFPAKLIAYARTPERAAYRIVGAPNLRLWVSTWSFEVAVMFRRECWDLLTEYDVSVKRAPDGTYFCTMCADYRTGCEPASSVEYFPDCMSLFVKHSFEPFLTWCNENIRRDRVLVVHRERGMTAAGIMSKREFKARRSGFLKQVFVMPVLARP